MTNTTCHKRLTGVAIVLPLLVVAGCGDGRPNRVPISGHVTIDGEPLPRAFVKFVPAEGRPAGARTDSEGRFVLTCYERGDGATLGTHQVTVRATDEVSNVATRWRTPKKYNDTATSGIAFDITEPRDDLDIELTWDGDKPFVERDTGG